MRGGWGCLDARTPPRLADARRPSLKGRIRGRGSVASDSNCQTAKLHRLAAENRASFGFFISIGSLQKREQSAVWRKECRALARSTGPILADRPRLTALHCGVLSPWCPTSPAWLEREQGIDPGPRNGPGGCPPRTPGTTVSETAGAGAAPHPRSVRLQRRPSVDRDGFDLAERQISSTDKNFSQRGFHWRETGPVVARRGDDSETRFARDERPGPRCSPGAH